MITEHKVLNIFMLGNNITYNSDVENKIDTSYALYVAREFVLGRKITFSPNDFNKNIYTDSDVKELLNKDAKSHVSANFDSETTLPYVIYNNYHPTPKNIIEFINSLKKLVRGIDGIALINDKPKPIDILFYGLALFSDMKSTDKLTQSDFPLNTWRQTYSPNPHIEDLSSNYIKNNMHSKTALYIGINTNSDIYFEERVYQLIPFIKNRKNSWTMFIEANSDMYPDHKPEELREEFMIIDIEKKTGKSVISINKMLLELLYEIKNDKWEEIILFNREELAENQEDQDKLIQYIKNHQVNITILNEVNTKI